MDSLGFLLIINGLMWIDLGILFGRRNRLSIGELQFPEKSSSFIFEELKFLYTFAAPFQKEKGKSSHFFTSPIFTGLLTT